MIFSPFVVVLITAVTILPSEGASLRVFIVVSSEMVVSTIGAFEEEQKAFDLMSRLIWELPLFMAVAALIDLLLVLVYMNWLHPWRGILEDVSMVWILM